MCSNLNVDAAAFVPALLRNPKLAEAEPTNDYFRRLPHEVLAYILQLCVINGSDAATCALACKQLKSAAHGAHLAIRLACTPEKCRVSLHSICRQFKGIWKLDLSGSAARDNDVAHVLKSLPQLKVLLLNSCRKLTPGAIKFLLPPIEEKASNLARGDASHQSSAPHQAEPTAQLQGLALSRCFQLDWRALLGVLQAAQPSDTVDNECLAGQHSVVLLSHLDLKDLAPPACLRHRPALRILALHNCGKLSPNIIYAIGRSCRNLEMLLLGGSPEGIQQGEPPSELAELYCSASAEVGQIVEALPHSVAGRLPPAAAFASHLAVFAANAPLLTTLELTGLGIYLPVSAILATDAFDRHFSTLDRPPPQVWDFGQLSSLHSAVQMLRDASSNATGHAEQLLASEIQMTLEAAVNSSTIGRRTPLYYAADNGKVGDAKLLLQAGAYVNVRDQKGTSALFTACFHGHAAMVELLLAAGADAVMQNAAGESPVYISSLRGHFDVVVLLLQHFERHGIPWQEANLHSDGWSPLMAAAVADRIDISQRLLQQAGCAAPALIAATNRYGQSVLHIAARRGCLPLLKMLVATAPPQALEIRNAAGDTPATIATNLGHGDAASILRSRVNSDHRCSRRLPLQQQQSRAGKQYGHSRQPTKY